MAEAEAEAGGRAGSCPGVLPAFCSLWVSTHPKPCLPEYGHPALTVDPDNGAAGHSAGFTLVPPTILQGGASDDQLSPASLIAELAPC